MLSKLAKRQSTMQLFKLPPINDENNKGSGFEPPKTPKGFADPINMTWQELAETYDRFFFYFFSIFVLSVTVIFMTALTLGAEVNS